MLDTKVRRRQRIRSNRLNNRCYCL